MSVFIIVLETLYYISATIDDNQIFFTCLFFIQGQGVAELIPECIGQKAEKIPKTDSRCLPL